MARNTGNVVIVNQTGKIGNLCLQKNGIIRTRLEVTKRNWSPRQLEHLKRMEDAKAYARKVKNDAGMSAPYFEVLKKWKKKLGPNVGVYQLAIRDFMHPPVIYSIQFDHNSISGLNCLLVRVYDEFHIDSVRVAIMDHCNEILEEGPALKFRHIGYLYELKHWPLPGNGYRVEVRVMDRPGNLVTKTLPMPDGNSCSC